MRPEKESMLAELKEVADDSVFLIFTDFTGITMPQSTAIRTAMREKDANVRMVKNRMFRHVAKDMGMEDEMAEGLKGPTGLVYGNGEVSEVASALKDFIKANDVATIKMGAMEGAFLSKDQLMALAELPTRPELLSLMLGCIMAPAQNLANLLNNSMGEFAGLLAAYEDKLKDEG